MGLRDKARESATKTAQDQPREKEPELNEPEPTEVIEREPPEGEPAKSGRPPLEPSVTYLVEEERPDLAYTLFKEASSQGMKGMIVSRTYPRNLRKSLDLGDTPILWLTNAMSDEAIGPKDLDRLMLTIRRFLEEGDGKLVLIDSLEYVITNNKFVSVLRLLQTIRDQVAVRKAIGIISLKSSTLEPARLAQVQNELEVYAADKSVVRDEQESSESLVISELRQDELHIEGERLEGERKKLQTQSSKLAAEAQKLAADRHELEKERQEVRQTLLRVRQTRKELENFRIEMTRQEVEMTQRYAASSQKRCKRSILRRQPLK